MPVDTIRSTPDDLIISQAVGGVRFTPSPAIMAPAGMSTVSSVAPADECEVPKHRPVLPEPKNIGFKLIDRQLESERLNLKSVGIADIELTTSMSKIEKDNAEKLEALEQEAKAANARATWSALSIVSEYIASAGMIFLGAASVGVPAVLLILAGTVGILNRAIHDTYLLQSGVEWYTKSEELQKTLTHKIEMGAFFLQMGLGLAGGFAAWQSGTLAAAQINSAMIKNGTASIITGASATMRIGGEVGTAYYNKKLSHLSADLKDIETRKDIENQKVTDDKTHLSNMIRADDHQINAIRTAVKTLAEASQE